MSRPSRALIDVQALRRNYRLARQLHGGRAIAVLKANAYGHGAVACARALESIADGFAVAFLDEAIHLRHAGIGGPILVLEGCFTRAELVEAHAHNCWVAVHQEEQLRALEHAPSQIRGIHAWLKFDSGMRRAGFPLAHANALAQRLQRCAAVSGMTLMTHFARADEPDSRATADQIEAFDVATAGISGDRSLANSAGLLAWPAARRDWSRPGILLYGADPLPGSPSALSPVMTLESEVFAVRDLAAGDALGYGAHYVAPGPRRVGLVAIGYADGYPRTVPQGTPVMVGAHRTQIVGRVSMDMLTIDLTDFPSEGVGSKVELWGKNIPVNDVASAVGTIGYELLCHVQRVPRIYEDVNATT
jgi:alanine racemase